MQQLHLVGFTADNRGLIFSARKGAKSGGFVVPLDDTLLERVDEMVARREAEEEGHSSNRPKSSLSPREIQARLRAGRSIAQVAREAGVEEEWVARWAAPIGAEQAQVIERARELTMEKNRVGPSVVPLGESVRWNMADRGIVFTDAGWTGSWEAFHLRANSWMVRFTYVYRRATHQAEWEIDTRDGVVISRNRQATELGYVAPGTRRPKMPRSMLAAVDLPSVAPQLPGSSGTRRIPPGAEATPPATRPAPARKKAAGGKNVAARTAAAKKKWAAIKKAADRQAAADRVAAKKAAVKRAADAKKAAEARKVEEAKRAAAKRAEAQKAAAKKAAAKKAAAKKAEAKKAEAKKAAAKRAATKKAATKNAATKRVGAKKPTKGVGAKKAGAKKPAGRRPASKSAAPQRSVTGKPPARRATSRPAPTSASKKSPARVGAANRKAPAAAPVRVARQSAEPRRMPSRPSGSRPAESASPRPSRRPLDASEREEGRFAPVEPERAAAARETDFDPSRASEDALTTPARTPIRIESGVPRRSDSGSSPIIRADRADQSREEPAKVAGSSENGASRQGRFRFRRGRTRS